MKVGHIISKLRYKNGYTQIELAEKIGVTKGAIGMYETDKRQPNYDVLIKLADLFNVTTDYLLSHNNSYNDSNTMIESDPTVNKLLATFSLLDEDNKDILLGKSKELLKQQRLEEKRNTLLPTANAK